MCNECQFEGSCAKEEEAICLSKRKKDIIERATKFLEDMGEI